MKIPVKLKVAAINTMSAPSTVVKVLTNPFKGHPKTAASYFNNSRWHYTYRLEQDGDLQSRRDIWKNREYQETNPL